MNINFITVSQISNPEVTLTRIQTVGKTIVKKLAILINSEDQKAAAYRNRPEDLSVCCGAKRIHPDMDLCSDCKEHADFESEDDEDEPVKCEYCGGSGESGILASREEPIYRPCTFCKGSGMEPDIDRLINLKDERH